MGESRPQPAKLIAIATPRRWVWPCLLAGVITYASAQSHIAAPEISYIDKYTHFLVYGLLGTLIARTPQGLRWPWLAIVAASLFGVSDEFHQSFTPGRSVEFADWLADTCGAALAVTLYLNVRWYRNVLEIRLGRSQTRVENARRDLPKQAA